MDITIAINGKDISSHTATPIKWNALLDERLDEGRLSIRQVTTELYPIGAQVKITVGDTDKDFIISADESVEVPPGSSKYDHELSLIEPTKMLEGIVVESLTFTNNLGRTYDVDPIVAPGQGYTNSVNPIHVSYKENYITPLRAGTLHIFSVKDMFAFSEFLSFYTYSGAPIKVHVTGSDFNEGFTSDDPKDVNKSFSVNLSKVGAYTIDYEFSWMENKNGAVYRSHYWFDIVVVPQSKQPLPKWNIRSVIDRVLNLAEPHLQSVSPRYKLDPTQAAEFEKILAPEFAFTKCTLKEILDQIGGFIHGIPRLIRGESGKFDTIHYDMLGGTDEALISSENTRYITEIHSHNIEDYVTELDSTVDNLVNTLNSDEGAVTEPYAGGFKSVRSEETYARIEEGNMVISTTLPIYSVQKLEVITHKNEVKDITAYIFEGAEYGRLSSFDGNYPTSKAFAIYYNLGEKNIRGLNYKSPTVIGGAGAKYSIANIIATVSDWDIGASWWADITKDGKTISGNYPKLAFRITYTPIFSARILQHKPYIEAGALKRSLVYNQGANLVETRYYGENMRGVIARMGNPEFTRTYRMMKSLSKIPKIGQIFKRNGDEYFVSAVVVSVNAAGIVDFTVGMSKDFNRLSQYIGINSEWRAYEVSERRAYNRDIVYRDFCVIGDSISDDITPFAAGGGFYYIANTFSHSAQGIYGEYYSEPITLAQVTTYDEQDNPYPVTLPVVSTAFGNAMVFSFGMADNYSAGPQSVYDSNGDVSGYWQTDVPYVDYYGRIKSMEFDLAPKGVALKFGDKATFDLPNGDEYERFTAPISTPYNDQLVIDKNGSEILRINYQLEFVSNWKELIIGSALARNCLMVTSRQVDKDGNAVHAAAVYVVNKKVGRFDSTVDLTSATLIYDYRNNVPTLISDISLGNVTSTVAGAAWVIADQSNGDILLAQNMDIAAGDTIHLPNISLTHNLP